MVDLTDSFEQQMLRSMQRATMEGEGIDEEEDDKPDMDRFHYGNDSQTDSSDEDTSVTTNTKVSCILRPLDKYCKQLL